MVHEELPTRRHQDSRARILAGAMDLVRDDGLPGLSMHRLAKSLRYTPGALYRYFESKDALIAALTAKVLVRFGAVAAAARRRLTGAAPLRDALVTLLVYRDLARAAPEEFGLLSLIIADPKVLVPDPQVAAPAAAAIRAELNPLAGALASAGVERADSRALALFAAVHGVLVMRKQAARVPGFDPDRQVVDLVRALLTGWGVDPQHLNDDLATLAALGDLVEFAGGLP